MVKNLLLQDLCKVSNKDKARKNLVRVHKKVVDCRNDWFWKLAHELKDKFDYLFF